MLDVEGSVNVVDSIAVVVGETLKNTRLAHNIFQGTGLIYIKP